MPSTYTPMQAAIALDWSLSAVYRRARLGVLPSVRDGDRLGFDAEHVKGQVARQADAAVLSMTVAQAAERLGLSRAMVYHLAEAGRLDRWPTPYRDVRISNASVEAYASSRAAA